MLETIQNITGLSFEMLVAATSFICGVSLLYLVIMRTLKKRADEAEAPSES